MISIIKTIALPLILAMGSNAINSCLDGEIAAAMVGEAAVGLSGCGLVDADHEDISTFLDTIGRGTLSSLDLSDNELDSLDEDLLAGATGLLYFYANDNNLATLPSGIFRDVTLKFLELNNNNLVSLPSDVFIGQSLTSLKLAGNPLECVPEVGQWSVSYTLVVDAGIGDCRYASCTGEPLRIGDSYCTEVNNNEECEWDGGDCCSCHCSGYGCRSFYQTPVPVTCKDPTAICQDEDFKDDESEEEEDTGPTCANDLPGYDGSNDNGDVCCPLGCGSCGGPGCVRFGSEEGLDRFSCCINGILGSQLDCSETGEAPCVVARPL